jgi:hypothetical protein
MNRVNIIKKYFSTLLLCLILAACTPVETVVQTAIAQTQNAVPTATSVEPGNQKMIQSAVAQTLTPAFGAVSTDSGYRIQTAVNQTLTAIIPTQTPTPLISPTPLTPTPTLTSTHAPWPTITNTIEPYVPSGPITLSSVKDAGDYKAQLSWQAEGSFQNGFYVLWSANNSQPTYPDDYWFYFANGHIRTAVVNVKQGKAYYFRICEFDTDRKNCVNYSNVLQVTIK